MDAETSADLEGRTDVREYLAALRRRKWLILGVTLPLAAIAFFIALTLPAVYRSTATILVQEQEVPPDLVRSTITSFADERIQVISQQVMTRPVLLNLVDRFGLYEGYRGQATEEAIVDRMRRDITISTVTADMSDRGSGRRVNATIAFKISYDAPDPASARRVANELATLFLNENVKARQQSVAETTAFLAQEADRLSKQIQSIEAKLAAFKRRNIGRLPESSAVNVQLAERTESEIQRVEREISLLQDRKLSLEAQLALVKPMLPPPVSPTAAGAPVDRAAVDERLRALQSQYASSSAIYGADHPDVRRLRREIAALAPEAASTGGADAAEQRRKLETELAVLRERYGETHPDVQRLRRSIAALGSSSAATAPPKPVAVEPAPRPDNPAYVVLAAQLESAQRELKQLAAMRDDLRARQRTYDARLLQIPEVEREYNELTRDYNNAQQRYQEIRTKQMQAEGALELEKDQKAERFSLGEPANLPHSPHSPNRQRIVLLGLLASMGSGLGLAWLRELFDSSVKGPLELARIAPAPVLTAIPYIETRGERVGKRRRVVAMASLAAVVAGAVALGLHFFVKPLPALLESVLARVRLG